MYSKERSPEVLSFPFLCGWKHLGLNSDTFQMHKNGLALDLDTA